MHPFIKEISNHFLFLAPEKREAVAKWVIEKISGLTDQDFTIIRTVKLNRREKKELTIWITYFKKQQIAKKAILKQKAKPFCPTTIHIATSTVQTPTVIVTYLLSNHFINRLKHKRLCA